MCRTASHLFEWLHYLHALGRGTGSRGVKHAVAAWYESRKVPALTIQAIKYRQRHGWTHKRALEIMHKGAGDHAARRELYLWMRGKEIEPSIPLLKAHLEAMASADMDRIAALVSKHRLPWEAIPTEALNDPGVWKAAFHRLPQDAGTRALPGRSYSRPEYANGGNDGPARRQEGGHSRDQRL